MLSHYVVISILILISLTSCQKDKIELPSSREVLPLGVLVFRRNFKSKEFSRMEVLQKIRQDLKKENLDSNINLTLSFSRLTIAGQTQSSSDLHKIIQLAFKQKEITEIISTVIITGDKSEEAIL